MKVREYEIKYRDKLQFFKVYDKYINELRKIVDNVCDNKNEKRLHIGIVLVINNRLYLAPMTSNGKKYLLTNKKHRRIAYPIKNGELGFIRIGNMIPLADKQAEPIFIRDIEDEKYKNLLIDQYNFLSQTEVIKEIREKANILLNKRYNNDNFYLADIMCNFKLLEQKCEEFEKDMK